MKKDHQDSGWSERPQGMRGAEYGANARKRKVAGYPTAQKGSPGLSKTVNMGSK